MWSAIDERTLLFLLMFGGFVVCWRVLLRVRPWRWVAALVRRG